MNMAAIARNLGAIDLDEARRLTCRDLLESGANYDHKVRQRLRPIYRILRCASAISCRKADRDPQASHLGRYVTNVAGGVSLAAYRRPPGQPNIPDAWMIRQSARRPGAGPRVPPAAAASARQAPGAHSAGPADRARPGKAAHPGPAGHRAPPRPPRRGGPP